METKNGRNVTGNKRVTTGNTRNSYQSDKTVKKPAAAKPAAAKPAAKAKVETKKPEDNGSEKG